MGAEAAELLAQADLLRDTFGSMSFRHLAVNPSCLTPGVVELAQAIYDYSAFDRMPILADALEKAGCDNEEILRHLRGPGPHGRGCFVVDLLLGKE